MDVFLRVAPLVLCGETARVVHVLASGVLPEYLTRVVRTLTAFSFQVTLQIFDTSLKDNKDKASENLEAFKVFARAVLNGTFAVSPPSPTLDLASSRNPLKGQHRC